MTQISKFGLVLIIALVIGTVAYKSYQNKAVKPALVSQPEPSNSSNSLPLEPKVKTPPKLVSIPNPARLAKSDQLTAKSVLNNPNIANADNVLTNPQANSQAQNQTNNEFRVNPDVVDKIIEQTGISQQDMERAMTQEAH